MVEEDVPYNIDLISELPVHFPEDVNLTKAFGIPSSQHRA